MSGLLLISRSRRFEARLRTLLNEDLHAVSGRTLAKGASAVLASLDAENTPDVALLGPALSYAQAYELSAGLNELYPRTGIMLVRGDGPGVDRWLTDMKVHALASPLMPDMALLRAVQDLAREHGEGAPFGTRGASDRGRDSAHVAAAANESPAAGTRTAEHDHPTETMPDEAVGQTTAPGETTPDRKTPDATMLYGTTLNEVVQGEAGSILPREAAEGDRTTGRVIAVVSPKGGMGKTTVATNLALGLARLSPSSVVLIDGDVQFGDVATTLGLNPNFRLPDVVTEAAITDPLLLKTYLTLHQGGFYTVCGADSPVDGDRVTGEQLAALIAQLSRIFTHVVIDTAPGLGDHTLAVLDDATDVVLICGMSVACARGLRSHLATLGRIGILPTSRHVVLNFADRTSGLTVRDIEAITGVPVDIAVPRHMTVALSSNLGIPVLQGRNRSPASKALTELVDRFDPDAAPRRGKLHRRVVVA